MNSPTILCGSETGVPDELLMEAIANDRSEEALGQLYARHKPMLRAVISRVMFEQDDVEDTLQDVLIQLWERADSYSREKGKVAGWLIILARRRAMDRLRRRYAYCRARDRYEVTKKVEIEAERMTPDGTEKTDMQSLFTSLMHQLPPAQEETLKMAFLEGKSQRQISAILAVPLGTVKTRVELGLKKLSKAALPFRSKILG